MEIFFHLTGKMPAPIVDTQVAAMVCGFGDAVSYETLAAKLAGARIDKSSRFTDWAHRPLTERQLALCALRRHPSAARPMRSWRKRIDKTGRADWVDEEMAVLTDPDDLPRRAARGLAAPQGAQRTSRASSPSCASSRPGARKRRSAATCRATACCKDEALIEIAAHAPSDVEASRPAAAGCRAASPRAARARQILAAVERGLAAAGQRMPEPAAAPRPARGHRAA